MVHVLLGNGVLVELAHVLVVAGVASRGLGPRAGACRDRSNSGLPGFLTWFRACPQDLEPVVSNSAEALSVLCRASFLGRRTLCHGPQGSATGMAVGSLLGGRIRPSPLSHSFDVAQCGS